MAGTTYVDLESWVRARERFQKETFDDLARLQEPAPTKSASAILAGGGQNTADEKSESKDSQEILYA